MSWPRESRSSAALARTPIVWALELRGFGASGLRGSLDLCRRTVGIRLLWGSVLGFVVVICLFILDVEINVYSCLCLFMNLLTGHW